VSGQAAKDRLAALAEVLDRFDYAILQGILQKNPHIGVNAKTINKAIPGLIPDFSVMLAKKWSEERFNND
jgi:hypothetical protein